MLDETNTGEGLASSETQHATENENQAEYRPKRTRRPPANPENETPSDEAQQPHLTSFAPKGRTRKPATRRTNSAESAPNDNAAETPEAPAAPAPEPTGEETPQTSTPRTTRRRSNRPKPAASEQEPQAPVDDAIAEALTALGNARRDRKPAAKTTDESFQGETLDDLVQVIAASPDGESGSDSPDGSPRRRRRRRGGRKRRKDGPASSEDGAAEESADETEEAQTPTDQPEEGDGSRHRRRRRRRKGEDVDEAVEGDVEVVVKVREQRPAKSKDSKESKGQKNGTVTGIDGSTRLEAKKQRRREGRAASRRRAPILSEAEFLARRESVERKMLIRQKATYSQIAVVEDNVLVEHYVDRASAASLIGNIYLGKIQNVLPGMEAAFIDIGRGRNAVLYAGEVDWDSFGEAGANRKIEDVFSAGQLTIVQVSKDPVGAKGARLTSHISIPGRYVVYAPKGHISGVSRKLSEAERNRLKTILDSLVDEAASVVIRTAAESASEDELVRDVSRLKAQWDVIEKKAQGKQTPQLLYSEPDLTMRIVRDLFTEDFAQMIVDGSGGLEDAYETVEAYVQHVAPHLAARIEKWDRADKGDLFAKYRIDEQIAKALDRKVHLPSGGSLVIDRTEAMTVIDVNTGKFTGSGGNLEATVTSNNLEAAEEIVRQLRLRDIGGIIIIDFIDMVLPSNRELLLRRLVECLGRDRTRHQVSEVTSLGLVQLTRKKVGTGLAEAFTRSCEACDGQGRIRFEEPVENQAASDGGERHPPKRTRRKSSSSS